MIIHLDQFGGVMPKVSPHLLPVKMATVATNCRLGSGALESWKEPGFVDWLAKAEFTKTIYLYDGQYWLHWTEDVDVVKAPVALDLYDRVYWTGEIRPYCGGNDILLTGGTNYPEGSYIMGVPSSKTPPTFTVIGSANGTPYARSYLVTYVNGYGGEGPPSMAAPEQDVILGQGCTVTRPATSLTGYNITHWRLYRTETGTDGTKWMLVTTLDINTTTYTDYADADTLTTELPSLMWDEPPDGLKGLVAHPMGSLVGFDGQEVIFSEPYRPHAWPYRYAVSDPVVALGVYGSYVLVTTTGKPYILTGSDPAAMTTERLERGEACVSKRGLVDMGTVCVYPGPSGLWGVGTGDIALLTKDVLDTETWQSYKPESILGAYHDGQYIGFYDTGSKTGGFIFDPSTGDFSEIAVHATAAWSDPHTGKLYLAVDGAVKEWNKGITDLNYTWKSRPYNTPKPINFACARVVATDYPVTLKIYADGVLRVNESIENSRPFWLPSGYRANEWYAELTGIKTVQTLTLATSMRELDEQ